MWTKIYLGTVLFGMIPYALERTIFEIRLKKEGYKIVSDRGFIHEIIIAVLDMIPFFIPVINIFKGFKYIRRVIKNKYYYNLYKGKLLIDDEIGKINNNEIDGEEYNSEMDKICNVLIDGLEVSEEERQDLRKALEASEIIDYLKENNCEINITQDMELDEMYDYLINLKEDFDSKKENEQNVKTELNKSKSFDEMTNEEKISYLRREKEDALSNTKEEEMKLKMKKGNKEE